jgi:hypothetical protein
VADAVLALQALEHLAEALPVGVELALVSGSLDPPAAEHHRVEVPGEREVGEAGLARPRVQGQGLEVVVVEVAVRPAGIGHAGSVEVKANELRIEGSSNPEGVTGIVSRANPGSLGDAGTVRVTVAGLMELLNGGVITSSTFAQGSAGSVEVQAGKLRINDFGTPDQFTGITSQASRDSSGNAGSSYAAYAARAGIRCRPSKRDSSPAWPWGHPDRLRGSACASCRSRRRPVRAVWAVL